MQRQRSSLRALLLTALLLACQLPVGAEAIPEQHQQPLKELKTPKGLLNGRSFSDLIQLPQWMELSLAWMSEPMGNTAGGTVRSVSTINQLSIDLAFGPGLRNTSQASSEWERWQGRLSLAHLSGQPPFFNEQIGVLFPTQELVTINSGFWLQGIWLERQGETLSLQLGPNLPMQSLFGAPAYNFYVNSTINGSLNLALPGYPIAPANALGGNASWQFNPQLSLHYGAYQLNKQRGGVDSALWKGWRFNVAGDDGIVQALRLDWALDPKAERPLLACESSSQPRRYLHYQADCSQPIALDNMLPDPLLQLGGIAGSWRFPQLRNTKRWENTANTAFAHANLPLKLPIGHGSRIWASGAYGFEPAINAVPTFVEGGLLIQGVMPNRPLDVLVLGASRSGLSPYSRGPNGERQSYEAMVELDYILQLSQNLQLQPGVQFVINPGGSGRVPGVIAPGVQISLNW